MHVADGAGHFSFMDIPPPHIVEPLPDKKTFLQDYSQQIVKFVLG
jgi:hypothetical protein